MDTREMLEKAAKAAGLEGQYECWAGQGFMEGIRLTGNPKEFKIWNSLMYNDQAFRLAVKLCLTVAIRDNEVEIFTQDKPEGVVSISTVGEDKDACVRYAITLAAALGDSGG